MYCEKPACYNIYEGQRMIEVAQQTKKLRADRVTAPEHGRSRFRGCRRCNGGIIGDVYMSKGPLFQTAAVDRTQSRQPLRRRESIGTFSLGPAPLRPFNELRFSYNWHWFWDTGNGDIGNQGVA